MTAAMHLAPGAPHPAPAGAISRTTLPDARPDRLWFGQVREDPLLETYALEPAEHRTLVVVSSGGCTALSLLAAGAGRVIGVDVNPAQHHLVELKLAAARALPPERLLAFLGAAPDVNRVGTYIALRPLLSDAARAWWDRRPALVRAGAMNAGVTERLLRHVCGAVRTLVHRRATVARLLACRTLAEQRALYHAKWDTWRWRLLFRALLGRRALERAYDPAFFAHVEQRGFAEHFLATVARGLTECAVHDNYFLHHLLTGRYPAGEPGGVPPWLAPAGLARLRDRLDALRLVDGSVTACLRTLPDASVHGFALSNVMEWLDPAEIDALFAEVVRTAAPGARLVFRNFVGWTEVPERWRGRVREDRVLGETLIRRDRSLVQRRIAVCRLWREGV
ncbi:MAG TPA: DUF3419 family protein [Gemmatimonadaceae bacterium]|nr:DUF3419 family protein [Gemmatimonadaceae bacterium]